MTRPRVLLWIALSALGALAFLVRGPGPMVAPWRAQRLVAMVPDLDPELARHVVSDPDRDWNAYCRATGVFPLMDASKAIDMQLLTDSYDAFARRRERLQSAALRIAQGFELAFGWPSDRRELERCRARSTEEDFEIHQLTRRHIAALSDIRLDAEKRLRLFDALIAEMVERGDPQHALNVQVSAARSELERGRRDRHRARLESGLTQARALGDFYLACQILGELGVVHWEAGHEDSMRACFDEGMTMARRHGFMDQSARLLKFDAAFYAERGRLALATERLAEVQRFFEAPGGGSARLRMQIEYAKFLANLHCWDLVERSLRRIPPLQRAYPKFGRAGEREKLSFDVDRLRARVAFAAGHPEEGDGHFRRWNHDMPHAYRRMGYAELFDDWSAGLFEAGRPQEALAVCERGVAHCDSAHVPERGVPLRIRRARVLESLGRLEDARRALDDADSALAKHPDVGKLTQESELLRARLLFREGQTLLGRKRIREIVRQFQRRLRDREGGPQGYLELDEALSLRDAVHETEGFSAAEGYQFELAWRSLASEMAGGGRPETPQDLFSRVARPRGTGRGTMPTHLVYHFTRAGLVRWTASRDGVVLDTLPLSARQCLADVREAVTVLQTEIPPRGQVLGPRALERLRRLSKALLPPSLGAGTTAPIALHVSPDGPLVALPFEALPARGPNGEGPLALWADLAYVRGLGQPPMRAAGPVVIVSNPRLSSDVRRRYSGMRQLRASEGESKSACERWPLAIHLEGERATKDSIIEHWRRAPVIYLAAHHVSDPDAPFLGFVPLAAPPGSRPDAALLEIADVLPLDLSGCRLVVLASCASGSPYRFAVRPGPSLGDAFLDAGAHAVVQSFWNVADEETRDFMKMFLSDWSPDADPAAALGRARRKAMATAGVVSPRIWAAWSVQRTLP